LCAVYESALEPFRVGVKTRGPKKNRGGETAAKKQDLEKGPYKGEIFCGPPPL